MRRFLFVSVLVLFLVASACGQSLPNSRSVLAPVAYCYNFDPSADFFTIDFRMANGAVRSFDLSSAQWIRGSDLDGPSYSVLRVRDYPYNPPTYVFLNMLQGELRVGKVFDFDPAELSGNESLGTFRIDYMVGDDHGHMEPWH